jgi:hypothetical protein
LRLVEPISAADEAIGEFAGELRCFPVLEAMLGDKPRQE